MKANKLLEQRTLIENYMLSKTDTRKDNIVRLLSIFGNYMFRDKV